jgi:hypothetical protein
MQKDHIDLFDQNYKESLVSDRLSSVDPVPIKNNEDVWNALIDAHKESDLDITESTL